MRVVLLGDSHLARVRRDLHRLAPPQADSVVNAAVGGAVAGALRLQALDVPVAPTDAVVVSIGTNDAAPWSTVTPEQFRRAVEAFLEIPAAVRVLLAPPGLDAGAGSIDPGRRPDEAAVYSHIVVDLFDAAAATVVDSPALLAPLASSAYADDGLHLTGAAYDVLLPAIRAALE